MKEIINRLLENRFYALEILTATFFIAFLNLGSPIFVINVLNRYVSYGFDGTLFTLTAGMLIVIALQHGFRIARVKLLKEITKKPDLESSSSFLSKLIQTRAGALERLHSAQIREMTRGIQTVQAAYDPTNVISILDAPFSLLYLVAVFFLSPVLFIVTLFGLLFMMASGFYTVHKTKHTSDELQNASLAHRSLVSSAISGSDTVRAFNGKRFLSLIWSKQVVFITDLRLKLSEGKEKSQAITLTTNTLMSVVLYAIGSYFVVKGELTIGALIGANILASRSYMNIVKLVQTRYLMNQASTIDSGLKKFMDLPVESPKGIALKNYKGNIAFTDLCFNYAGSSGPLFESLTLNLKPGEILSVTGKNGAGKTTLARLVAGLLLPVRGEISAGGINLNQLALPWWRQQLIYLPQEPTFINASIRENLTLIRPGIEDEQLNNILEVADLRAFLDRTANGMDTVLAEGGKNLSLGIRKRLALARALTSGGRIILFDEPMEGLDKNGTQAVLKILKNLSLQGITVITFSHDRPIIKGKGYILNLDRKPVPKLTQIKETNN